MSPRFDQSEREPEPPEWEPEPLNLPLELPRAPIGRSGDEAPVESEPGMVVIDLV